MKIIVVGLGKVGVKLTERLSQEKDYDITVIDSRTAKVNYATNEFDVMGIVGSGASVDVLEEAGIREADILIAVTGSDELNLLTCLIAKKLAGCQTVARVRKPEFGKEILMLKEDLGLAMVINPEQTAANEMARVLRFPSAIEIDTFAKGRVEILKFKLHEGSVLHNLRISEMARKLRCDVLVSGVEREDKVFIPDGNFIMKQGDLISIIAAPHNGSAFFETIGIKTNRVKDTMIVGGGDTAYYLANQLLQKGIAVKIIEQNQARCDELCQLLPKAAIIHGDGTDNKLLLEEGIEKAESFVALTNIDEENILLSLFAKSKTSGKLITKINRIAYDEVINNLDLDTTIYPKNITTEYILRFVRAKNNSLGSNIETMHYILDGKAEALEFKINENSPVLGIPLESLNLKKDILIACITRKGKVFIPRGKDSIEKDDRVIIVTATTGFTDISDILE